MYFRKLTITNIGPFFGSTEFDLSVGAVGKSSAQPVILFGGKNGAGKTNILESVRLCLYGKQAFGRKVFDPEYQREICNRIHRNADVFKASVEILFSYVRNGESLDICVNRSWEKAENEKFVEELIVRENGELMTSVLAEHWQEFIDDLLPPTLAQLFFFDGERIQELASEDQNQASLALSDAVRSLFGLSLVDRLVTDLALIEREAGKSGSSDSAKEIRETHIKLTTCQKDLTIIRDKLQVTADRIDKESTNRQKIGDLIRSKGGILARNREELKGAQAVAENRFENLKGVLRKEAAELLPFLLCRNLLSELAADIKNHSYFELESVTSKAIKEKSEIIRNAFGSGALARVDKTLSSEQKNKLQSYIEGLLAQLTSTKAAKGKFRHLDLSRTDVSRLEGFLSLIETSAAPLAKRLAVDLEIATKQRFSAQEEADNAPSHEDLQPMYEELNIITGRVEKLKAENDLLSAQEKEIESRISLLESRLNTLAKKAIKQSDFGLVFERSVTARTVVKSFGIQLTKRRLSTLAAEVLATYNLLARKDGMIDHLLIDSESFNIQLFTKALGRMPKDRLSAGERQILAISILWALAKLSGRAMPMIVDTPLGRLDSDHRDRLVNRYFTKASHQVIVLSTDEEVDEKFYKGLEPFIARSYHLNYDVNTGSTITTSGYFWSNHG